MVMKWKQGPNTKAHSSHENSIIFFIIFKFHFLHPRPCPKSPSSPCLKALENIDQASSPIHTQYAYNVVGWASFRVYKSTHFFSFPNFRCFCQNYIIIVGASYLAHFLLTLFKFPGAKRSTTKLNLTHNVNNTKGIFLAKLIL
jgi:hypothetical protein